MKKIISKIKGITKRIVKFIKMEKEKDELIFVVLVALSFLIVFVMCR